MKPAPELKAQSGVGSADAKAGGSRGFPLFRRRVPTPGGTWEQASGRMTGGDPKGGSTPISNVLPWMRGTRWWGGRARRNANHRLFAVLTRCPPTHPRRTSASAPSPFLAAQPHGAAAGTARMRRTSGYCMAHEFRLNYGPGFLGFHHRRPGKLAQPRIATTRLGRVVPVCNARNWTLAPGSSLTKCYAMNAGQSWRIGRGQALV